MRLSDDLDVRWIWVKGWLFLTLGAIAACGLLLLHTDLSTAVLLAAAIWGFSRFYFFAFYVIQRWCDPQYRFDGLIHFALWLARRRGSEPHPPEPPAQ